MREAIGDKGARFQSVEERGNFVCGEVNGRGRSGYVRFVYDNRASTALIDPGEALSQAPIASADPACSKPFAYQSVEERLGCAAAPARERETRSKRSFDALWHKACA